ncbi:MAG TPA: GNAT family N-acetyltransferase [Verrucomicrobiae bacterium]|nr:GNAT family N-acetyltransferase [Verrucomicrobiae bacterium]
MSDLDIRHLRPEDAATYAAFRRAALLDSPLSFMSSPEDDSACSPATVRERLQHGPPDSIIIGAFAPDLVGTLGLYRDSHVKAAHKVHLWGMHVVPAYRRKGIGARLLDAAILHARSMPGIAIVRLSVSSTAPNAQRLYERAGFRVWGTEPDSLRHNGQSATEYHMILRLV